jgi:choline dehydrogenase-like flavoprotein
MSDDFDAIVVGSGMTGGWAAKELCEHGLKTLVVERGRYVEHRGPEYTDLIPPWQSRFHGIPQEKFVAANPKLAGALFTLNPDNSNWFVKDEEQPYSTPPGRPYHWVRSYHLGGRSMHWMRLACRIGDVHFRANAADGHGIDWPIRYSDLARWYDHVEGFIGVAGSAEHVEQFPDGKYQPAFPLNCAELAFKARIEAAFPKRKVIPGPTANLTAPTEEQNALGRTACQARNYCHKGCHFGAYFSSLSATLPAAKQTGNLSILTDTIVHSVIVDTATRRATGVRVIDARKRTGAQYSARLIFLCAGTIPTTQILLLSSSEVFPMGLGNRSGALGHYFVDSSPGSIAMGVLPNLDDRYYFGRKPSMFIIPAYRNVTEPADGYLRSFGVTGAAYRSSWERGASAPGIGAGIKASLRRPGPWHIFIAAEGEMLPRWENHMRLHPNRVDRWGMPLVHIDVGVAENERRMAVQAKDDLREMLKAAGCVDIQAEDLGVPGAAITESGTAVMGHDPNTSVLNRWNQVHEVPNLFVTDGACMPSNGNPSSPSLTFMALTARAANYAAELVRGHAV